jgi:ABC-type multidrug transport system ATPase subunit
VDTVLAAEGLSKHFGDFRAVHDLSFQVSRGQIYGFLGPNGAGKSTSLRMLLGLIHPSSGSVTMLGQKVDPRHNGVLGKAGAIIERPDLYKYLSATEHLRMFSRLSGIKPDTARITSLLQWVGLQGWEKVPVRQFSLGMKQRLAIALSLVHDPEIIILDEPTNGLDPQGIADMRALIRQLAGELGKTVLLSSHLLHEVEQLADHMLILSKGEKVVEGAVKELLDRTRMRVEVRYLDHAGPLQAIAQSAWANMVTRNETGLVELEMKESEIPALNQWLVDQAVQVFSIIPRQSLEAYFLSLTQSV